MFRSTFTFSGYALCSKWTSLLSVYIKQKFWVENKRKNNAVSYKSNLSMFCLESSVSNHWTPDSSQMLYALCKVNWNLPNLLSHRFFHKRFKKHYSASMPPAHVGDSLIIRFEIDLRTENLEQTFLPKLIHFRCDKWSNELHSIKRSASTVTDFHTRQMNIFS